MVEPIVPIELRRRFEEALPKRRKNRHVQYAGRRRIDPQKVLTGIVFVLKFGIPWKHLPSTTEFPCGETCRQWLLKWDRAGVWGKILSAVLVDLQRAGKINWGAGIVDSASVRSPSGGAKTGQNPTDRRKLGTKHHLLTDADGTPLAVIVTGANRHDVTQLLPLLDSIAPIRGKKGRPRKYPKRVLGDRAYDSEPHRKELKKKRHQANARSKKNSSWKWSRNSPLVCRAKSRLVTPIQKARNSRRKESGYLYRSYKNRLHMHLLEAS